MGDKPWKVHERAIARFFGVERQKRGGDFGVSDCDVLASQHEYADARGEHLVDTQIVGTQVTHIVVECKRHKELKLHEWMKKFSDTCKDKQIPILVWNEFRASWMEHRGQRVFDTVYNEIVSNSSQSIESFINKYRFGYVNRQTPKYLSDWYEQARAYCMDFATQYVKDNPDTNYVHVLPLVGVSQNRMHGRILVWKQPSAEDTF